MLFFGNLRVERLVFAGGNIEIESGFGGVALQHPEPPGDRVAKLSHHLGPEFFVTLGFGGLALQRIHLAADFFQNVEHAREILLRAFELGFRQPFARFVLADAGGFFDDGSAIRGLLERIWPMRPCSMMA